MEVLSSCIYCGVGCRLKYQVENGVLKTAGDPSDPVSGGKPCVKGLTIGEVYNKNRFAKPQIRTQDKFQEVDWETAFDYIFKNTKDLAPQEVFFSGSGKITNEDNFVIQKFARKVFQTNNIDACCARLCHQATVQAMNDCFGTPNLTNLNNLSKIDTLLVIGSNPASNYPVFWNKVIAEKQKRNLKVLLVGAMISLTAKTLKNEDQVVILEQGSELVFLGGLLNFLISQNLNSEIQGFSGFKDSVASLTPQFVNQIAKIPEEEFLKACQMISQSQNLGIFHGMGLTQHVNGIENIHMLLNLVILKNASLLTLRGEINVQGAGDMHCCPNQAGSEPFEKGKNMIEAFYINPVKAAFISSFNPAQSLPDLTRLWQNLQKMFLVIINPHFNLTCQYADVILPSPILIERKGTITTGERRVRFLRQVIPKYGQSKPEWQIYNELAKYWHKENGFLYQDEHEIFSEITKTIPDYQHLSDHEIYQGGDDWPDKNEKFRKFMPEVWEGYDDPKSEKYPYLLTTFRQANSFLTGEETDESATLQKTIKHKGFFLNPQDSKELQIQEGQMVEVESVVAKLAGTVKIDPSISPKTIACSFHSKEFLVNTLFPLEFDEETFTPNFKATAVKIRKLEV